MSSAYDDIKIVGADTAASQELQYGKQPPVGEVPRAQAAWRHSGEYSLATDHNNKKLSVPGKMFPPGVEPLPGQE
jgi:hypothetical protein